MKRYRRLRRLVPDAELVRRRARGETLRELAADYGVAHTTLGRYFQRPEITKQLKEARRLVRRERQAAAAQEKAERRLERQVRRKAKEQIELERGLSAARALLAGRPAASSDYAAWLDARDARPPLTRADLHSQNDQLAADTVAAGGGVQAVIEATGLRTRENVLLLIDPVILVKALDNDSAATAVAEPIRNRLRRLVPDPELIRRRAAGEALRRIAPDYGVAHTTLLRYFKRPQVATQPRKTGRR